MQAVRQHFTTCRDPKELITAHGKPAAPLLPRISDSAVVAPIMVVTAAVSTRPLPKLKEDAEPMVSSEKGQQERDLEDLTCESSLQEIA